ncbi:hypothetical protein [Trinickia violacea]|uniref:hypothetical protein n=1 Tax=Trinickia violacea TaxID=2571746 RepID=UPI001C306603|nr:hypothetical protein [Trinickia violacea]
MPVFVIVALILLAILFRNTGVLRHIAANLLKSTLAVVVVMAAIILGVIALSSIQIP